MENQHRLSCEDININTGTGFSLTNEAGALDVSGNILDPKSLRALADTLEKLYTGQIQTQGVVGFDID